MTDETATEALTRIWALRGFGRAEAAIAEARRALAEYPGDPDLLGSLAWLEFFHGDRAEARGAAEQALAARPGDWRGLNILVEADVADGRPHAAEAHARQAVAAYPDLPDAWLALAYALAQPRKESKESKETRADARSRYAEIRDLVSTAVALDADRVETLRRGSILLAHAREERESARLLSRALEIEPDNEDLLMLIGTSPGASEVTGMRVLSGVLTANPQHRQAARELSDIVWTRALWLAAISLLPLAGMMLFGYLLFGDDTLETSTRQRRQIVGVFGAVALGWVLLYVSMRGVLPKGYLRRLFNAVWWVRFGLAIAGLATVATALIALAFAVRGLPTQQSMMGSYIGGLTAAIDFIAWLVLGAELLVLSARFVSERRNAIFPSDAEGLAAAKQRLRDDLVVLAIRGGAAGLFALVPLVAASIATRPEAANGFPAVAVAIFVPPVIAAAYAGSEVLRIRAEMLHGPRALPRVIVALCLLGALAALVGTWCIADWHAAQNDPPPTPYELELQEQQRALTKSLADLDSIVQGPEEPGPAID